MPILDTTSAYDSRRLLEGVVDVEVPDFRVWSRPAARRSRRRPDYPEVARAAVKEMARRAVRELHRQVGPLVVDAAGLVWRGLLLGQRVMPGLLAETEAILHFVAEELGPEADVDLMAQDAPAGLVGTGGRDGYGENDRHLSREADLRAVDLGRHLGLRLDVRSVASASRLAPADATT